MLRATSLPILALLLTIIIAPSVNGDRMPLPLSDIDVYGPGQKAILAWGGGIERLTISTDLFASQDTRILEILPLPSMPRVEKGSYESFDAIQRLIAANAASLGIHARKGLEIVFHEKIVAHDITVVKVSSGDELVSEIQRCLKELGLEGASIRDEAREILSDYLRRGYNYLVFDLVEVMTSPRSIDPIVYEFASPSIYYPLKVSSVAHEEARISLYIITNELIERSSLPPQLSIGLYEDTTIPVQFQLSNKDLLSIDASLARIVSEPAWLTGIRYEGSLNDLEFDLEISKACRSIFVQTDKSTYKVGDTVQITMDYAHLLPGCVEAEVVHFHLIRLEIFNEDAEKVESWEWRTDGNLHRVFSWTPASGGEYRIYASSLWDGVRLEVESEKVIYVAGWGLHGPRSTELAWLLLGLITGLGMGIIGMLALYFSMKTRRP